MTTFNVTQKNAWQSPMQEGRVSSKSMAHLPCAQHYRQSATNNRMKSLTSLGAVSWASSGSQPPPMWPVGGGSGPTSWVPATYDGSTAAWPTYASTSVGQELAAAAATFGQTGLPFASTLASGSGLGSGSGVLPSPGQKFIDKTARFFAGIPAAARDSAPHSVTGLCGGYGYQYGGDAVPCPPVTRSPPYPQPVRGVAFRALNPLSF